MPLLTREHSRTAYRIDVALYGLTVLALAAALVLVAPAHQGPSLAGWVLAGGLGWTLAEYLLHRLVLHGLLPFSRWHAEHHRRPTALISSPIVLSAALFAGGVAWPALWWLGAWPACALTLGLVGGYLVYGLLHHATHHPMPGALGRSRWLRQRRLWHALHHARSQPGQVGGSHYGVSCGFWDRVFRSH